MEHGTKIYCLMQSGQPMNKMLADALLFNAHDMFESGRTVQRIKSRRYDGVIESNLEVVDYLGVAAVEFEALVSTDKWESCDVRYLVRVDDLEGIEQCDWGQMQQATIGPIPVPHGEDPEEYIKQWIEHHMPKIVEEMREQMPDEMEEE